MIARARKLVATVRALGPGFFLERAFQRILPSRYVEIHRFLMYVQRAATVAVGDAGKLKMRWATTDDIDSSGALGYSAEICRRLFEEGARASVIEDEGKIVAYAWWATGTAEQMGIRFALEPSECFHTVAAVVPDHRGRGLHKFLLQSAAGDLTRTDGYEKFFAVIDNLNRNSRHTAKKIPGAHVLGTMFVLRVGKRYLIRDKAGVLIPADGGKRGRHWITRRGQLQAKVGLGELAG